MLCVTAGAFGDRWVAMARAFGADVTVLECEWGRPPDPAVVAEAMADETLRLAVVVHSETSTATVTDIQAIGELHARAHVPARDRRRLEPRRGADRDRRLGPRRRRLGLAEGHVDAARALVRERLAGGLGAQPRDRHAALLLRLEAHARRAERRRQPVHARDRRPCNALDVALDLVLDEGLEAIWERTRALAGRFRARVLASGLELYSPDDESCSLVTAVAVPEGADADELRRAVLAAGYIIEGGRGRTAGKVLRFGHLGATDEDALNAGLDALLAALPR